MTNPASDTEIVTPTPESVPLLADLGAAVPVSAEVIEPTPVTPVAPPVEFVPDVIEAPRPPVEPEFVAEPEPEKWQHPDGWTHDWLEFHGDLLAVRFPTMNMLASMNAARLCQPGFQGEMSDRYVRQCISPASIERVVSRMGDFDDEEYAAEPDAWTALMGQLGDRGAERVRKGNEALAEVQNGK